MDGWAGKKFKLSIDLYYGVIIMFKQIKPLLLIILFVIYLVISIKTQATEVQSTQSELNFACQYFKILYEYDINAAKFVNEGQNIKSQKQLPNFFKAQLDFVNQTNNELACLRPPKQFNLSFKLVSEGLKIQQAYLFNVTNELQKGSSFDKAFLLYNFQFINAQKHIQEGIQEFSKILNIYNQADQLKIFTTAGLTEEKFYKDFVECQYAQKVQENLN